MRLTADQTSTIAACARRVFGPQAQVLVYGSMLDDHARGGDVDLLVLTPEPPTRRQRALATLELERVLNRPVDLTAAQRGAHASAWVRLVLGQAQALEAAA
jgi:predicted nucleotidyltransferase